MGEFIARVPEESELSADYWDGHRAQDNCPRPSRNELFAFGFTELIIAGDLGAEVIGNFLNSPRALVKSYEPGEIVRAQDLEEDSVLRASYESLVLNKVVPLGSYHSADYWIVVRRTSEGRKAMFTYFQSSNSGDIKPGLGGPMLSIVSGIANHRITTYGGDKIERFRNLGLYVTGEGKVDKVREKEPAFELARASITIR